MKLAVSYLNSLYDKNETIKKINETKANYLHVDIMDGKYVKVKNYKSQELKKLLSLSLKPLDVHLMVNNPLKFLKYFKNLNVRIIYIHYSAYLLNDIASITKKGFRVGLAINPDEDLDILSKYFKYVDKVLVMSVFPGAGGQKFIPSTVSRLKQINKYRLDNNLIFSIEVDGGINDETITEVRRYTDDIVVGSFICKSENYDNQIKKLKIK